MTIGKRINKCDLILIILFIIISRLLFYFLLEIRPLEKIDFYMQIFPIEFLYQDLFKTLINGHSQPFGYNLFIGLLLKIFSGNELYVVKCIHLINIFITFVLTILSLKISIELFEINKLKKFFLIIILTFNPFFIFWENFMLYAHISLFLHVVIFYHLIIYFRFNILGSYFLIFLSLTLLTFIHALYHPFLLLLIFFIIFFLKKKFILKEFKIFLILFILSLTPLIKNYFLFNSFGNSSWMGFNWYATIHAIDHEYRDICYFGDITDADIKKFLDKKKIQDDLIYKKEFLLEKKSEFNNIGYIYKSKICNTKTIQFIFKNPVDWIISRAYYFFMSVGKFSIDYSADSLLGWRDSFGIMETIQNNDILKRSRQIFLIFLKFFCIFFLLKKIFTHNQNYYYKKTLLVYLSIVTYVVLVSHIFNAWEQERFMYSFWILNIIIINHILNFVKKN
jgi:hypothetical protein